MIKSFRNRVLRRFYETGNSRGINPNHVRRIRARLDTMSDSVALGDLNLPGYNLHELKGERAGTWSIHINGPWCITFRVESDGWIDVDYEQYH